MLFYIRALVYLLILILFITKSDGKGNNLKIRKTYIIEIKFDWKTNKFYAIATILIIFISSKNICKYTKTIFKQFICIVKKGREW